MKKITFITSLILIFLLGWFTSSTYSLLFITPETPLIQAISKDFSPNPTEKISPQDRVKENQIRIYEDELIIKIKDTSLASYTDTNSMDPILDYGANGIEINAESPDQIQIGDIIAYTPTWTSGLIVHRVIEKGIDNNGLYFITKGDNNQKPDPKIRFEQIKFILIGIIY